MGTAYLILGLMFALAAFAAIQYGMGDLVGGVLLMVSVALLVASADCPLWRQ